MILWRYTVRFLLITFIFDRCPHSWAAWIGVKYEQDIYLVNNILDDLNMLDDKV